MEIVAAELANLGSNLRALVLTDHERAAALSPMLVTGRAVATDAATARAFVAFASVRAPSVLLDPVRDDASGVEVTEGVDVTHLGAAGTAFFEEGGTQVLVGTRGLLGEGWDARRVNTFVDLTTATTPTSVVQTRGRALRIDPGRPEKVANNWTVVCVTEAHPNGASDWNRFVRKHDGYLAVTETGEIAGGVTHVDPALSPYAPPAADTWDAINAAMLVRAADRDRTRDLWQVGTLYRDTLVHILRVTPTSPDPTALALPAATAAGQEPIPPVLLPDARGAARRPGCPNPARQRPAIWAGALVGGIALTAAGLPWLLSLLVVLVTAALVQRRVAAQAAGALLASLARESELLPFAYAVADALKEAGMSAYLLDPVPGATQARAGRAWLSGRAEPNAVVYHAVPTAFASHAKLARCFASGWNRWVSAGQPIYTGSAESEGILVTHRGESPFAATTALRVAWT